MAGPLQPAPERTPLLDANGQLTEPWRRFFQNTQAVLNLIAITLTTQANLAGIALSELDLTPPEDPWLMPGPLGPPGAPGPRGFDGPDGLDAEEGLPGAVGARGLPGPMGPTGLDGLDADEGLTGLPYLGGTVPPAGGGTGTSTPFTPGSIVFAGVSGIYTQDNANFFWDATNKRVGVGLATPLSVFHTLSPETSSTWLVDTYSGGAVAASNNFLARSSRGTAGTPSATQNGDTLFFFQARGALATGLLGTQAAGFQFQAIENWTVSAQGTQIALNTTPAGSTTVVSGLVVGGAGRATTYNNVLTAGGGVPAIYGFGRSTAQAGAVASVATYTVGAADGSFLVSANVNITASTTFSFTVTCTYTDEGGTSRTLTLNFSQLTGTFVQTLTNVLGTGTYEGIPLHIRAKASTSITIATTGTFTLVTYNCEGVIQQMA